MKRIKETNKELSKKENVLLPIDTILNEKIVIPRLKVFEELCPEVIN